VPLSPPQPVVAASPSAAADAPAALRIVRLSTFLLVPTVGPLPGIIATCMNRFK